MPFAADGFDSRPDIYSAGAPTMSDHKSAALDIVPHNYGLMATLGGDALLAIPDLVDTVGSSKLVSWATGLERGDVNRAMLSTLDAPGLNNFYNNNKEGIEVGSGIVGVVASEIAAKKITAPAGVVMGALSKLPYARRIATLDAEYANAMNTVRNVDTELAARGAMSTEQYVGEALVSGFKYDSKAPNFFTESTFTINRDKAVFQAKGLGALKGIRNAAVTEAVMGITLNQNGFLYDDSAAQNMTWMALGLGVAGGAEWLHGAYQIRKAVNGDEIRRVFANALDPEGIEESRLLWHGKSVSPETQVTSFLGGTYTDAVTNMLVSATKLEETAVNNTSHGRDLLSQRNRTATQWRQLSREQIQKVTTRGISTNGFTRFSMDASGYGNHLDMVMYRDPAALYGVEMIGGIPDELTAVGVHESHVARTDERIAQAEERLAADDVTPEESTKLTALRKRLEFERSLTPQVLLDGEKVPVSEAASIEGFVEPRIVSTIQNDKLEGGRKYGMWEAHTESGKAPISIDSDFTIHMPSAKSIETADHYDVLRLYRASQQAVQQMAKFDSTLKLPEHPNWFQLDMAEEIMRTNEAARIQWPAGMTRESAQVESIAQKAAAMNQLQPAMLKAKDPLANMSKLRVRFNLPKLTAYERGVLGTAEHPIDQLLRGLSNYSTDEIRQMSLNDLKQGVAEFKRIGDMAPVTAKDIESLTGNSFRYMLDESGKPVKPILMYSRPFQSAEWNVDTVAERLAARKILTMTHLTAEEAGPLSKMLTESLTQSPDFQLAARTHELMDTQIQGGIGGNAPQNVIGAIGQAVVQSEWRDRDNPILLAATRLSESVNRVTRDYMRRIITDTFGDSLNVLENPRNTPSKLLLNQFHSFRSGWDLATKPVERDGFFAFALADTEKNRARWAETFGGSMAKGQTLMSPAGKEVVLDKLAMDLQQRFNMVSDALVAEKNTILRSQGMSEIERINWYTPPANTKGKYIGMVFGPDGKPVPGMSILASTPQEFSILKGRMAPRLEKLGMGYVFRTQDEVRDFASIWDKAQMEFVSPSTTAIQPGKVSRGVLTGSVINSTAFNESMQSMRDQFLAHSQDVVETMLKEQINSAKARANIAREMSKERNNPSRDIKFRSVYDIYLENLLGRNKINSEGSVVGKLLNPIEGTIDKVLAAGANSASSVWQATNGWIDRYNPWNASVGATKDFNTLSQALGKYMPFSTAAEMMERDGFGVVPPTLKGISNGLNQFSAAVLLRVMEVAHPIMNLTGMVNAMPAVIRSFAQRPGETVEEYAKRVGHAATIFDLPDGRKIGVADMGKIASRSFKRAWQAESHADFDYMVRRGFITQEVAEFHRQFGAIESKGSLEKFFMGDSTIKNPKGVKQHLASKGLVGWASVLSDKSEDFSRSWGHMAGLELADIMGITQRDARHNFAHDIANKMIANYSPQNRPEIFQGALGSGLGLFQSFIQNYYQRLFRYVETKDYKALVNQYAMQGSLFGVTSIPGWKEFNQLMADSDEGKSDPASGILHNMGGAGVLLSHGVISNIPTLFGAKAVDLYSRGDTSVRLPGTVAVPAFSVMQKIMTGISEGIKAFSDGVPDLGGTQLAEIASNLIPNRPIAGIIEQWMAHGNDTDAHGQLVSETKGMMEATYRLMGLRSQRQSEEVNMFYANKNAQSHKAANDDVLRLATRAALRAGDADALPKIFERYVQNGGQPQHFRRWLKSQYESATSTRGQRQLIDALKNPDRMAEVTRLMDAGVSIDADEKSPSPIDAFGQSSSGDELEQETGLLGNYSGQMTIPEPASSDLAGGM